MCMFCIRNRVGFIGWIASGRCAQVHQDRSYRTLSRGHDGHSTLSHSLLRSGAPVLTRCWISYCCRGCTTDSIFVLPPSTLAPRAAVAAICRTTSYGCPAEAASSWRPHRHLDYMPIGTPIGQTAVVQPAAFDDDLVRVRQSRYLALPWRGEQALQVSSGSTQQGRCSISS